MLVHTPKEFLYLASLVKDAVVILVGIVFDVLLLIQVGSDEVCPDQNHLMGT